MKDRLAIGIDLGGTNAKGVMVRENGEVLRQVQEPIQDMTPGGEEPPGHWKRVVRQIARDLGKGVEVDAFGLAAPGLPDESNECIAFMPGRLFGLEGLNWGDYLGKERACVLNDALAALVAECAFGVGVGARNVVMLTLGTGVGGGLMIDGNLHQGYGQRAGHFGHMAVDSTLPPGITGTPGSLEDAIGNSTVEARSDGKFKTTDQLVEAYQDGNALATDVWLDSVRKLAVGISSLCNAISPELVIVGGGISKAGDALFKPLGEFMEVYEWRPGGLATPVKKAELDEFAGAIGATVFALEERHSKNS